MDVENFRETIPATENSIYLNTGATSPSPKQVVEAMNQCTERHQYTAPGKEGMYPVAAETFTATRDAVARLINGRTEDIVLTQSTTDGLNIIAGGIEWDDNDTVVTTDIEHPSGVLPWTRGGAEVVQVESKNGYFDLDDWKDAVRDARLVAFSSVSWNYGTKLPVEEITEIAHDADTLVAVDAAQSPGHLPFAVREWGADFVAATGHKWILGPWGAGFLYVNPDSRGAIPRHRQGSKSIKSYDYERTSWEYKSGADRYHSATMSPSSYAGLRAAIDLQLDLGSKARLTQIRKLTQRLKDGLAGDQLLSPNRFETGLVSFATNNADEKVERLSQDGIEVRSIPHPKALRASVHAFNTESEIDTLVEAL